MKLPFLVIIPGILALVAISNAQTGDTTIHYDPSQCSTDPHGMIYFALGKRVLRQPMENIFHIVGYSEEFSQRAHLPRPPNSLAPEGCPDHPMQAMGYYLSKFSIFPEDPTSSEELNSGGGIELIHDSDGVYYGTQDVNERAYARSCQNKLIDSSTPGIIGCKWPLPADPQYQQCQSEDYQAKLDFYTSPRGRPFTAMCLIDWLHKPCRNICDISYKLYNDLNVWYKVDLSKFQVKDLVALDKNLRRGISAAEIPNYPWPAPNSSKGEGEGQ